MLTGLALVMTACGPPRRATIVVGSKNFTEQLILGEMLAQILAARTPLHVERRFYLGGTFICQQAMLAGRINTYVEYTGTALTAILKQPPRHNPKVVYQIVKKEYASRFHLDVLPPLGFNNTFVLVIRGQDARRDHIRTISQAVPYATHWRPGFGYEFMERADGYQGLVKTYGLKFGAPPRIMDLGLLYRALISRQVDIVAGNSTDGLLSKLDVVALKDNKHYFPPYQAVPIVREQTVREHPEVAQAIDALAGKITNQEMRRLNYEVDGLHRSAGEVARRFLEAQHLIP